PYQILVDYRTSPAYQGWGRVYFEGEYSFPGALARHRTAMVADFQHRKLLKKGNQSAPRVARFQIENRLPCFFLQSAHYYDQVGSNLTLDYLFDEPVMVRECQCRCVREWDVAQADST